MKCTKNIKVIGVFVILVLLPLTNVNTALADSKVSCNVKSAQIALEGHNIDIGPIDGFWGKSTSNGVKVFQSKKGIPESGSLDARTCKALGVKRTCKEVLAEWTTDDMDIIAASWGTNRETAKRIGLKSPAVVSPKGCYLQVQGTKVMPYCNGKPLTLDSCVNPYGIDPLQ